MHSYLPIKLCFCCLRCSQDTHTPVHVNNKTFCLTHTLYSIVQCTIMYNIYSPLSFSFLSFCVIGTWEEEADSCWETWKVWKTKWKYSTRMERLPSRLQVRRNHCTRQMFLISQCVYILLYFVHVVWQLWFVQPTYTLTCTVQVHSQREILYSHSPSPFSVATVSWNCWTIFVLAHFLSSFCHSCYSCTPVLQTATLYFINWKGKRVITGFTCSVVWLFENDS